MWGSRSGTAQTNDTARAAHNVLQPVQANDFSLRFQSLDRAMADNRDARRGSRRPGGP